MEPAFQSALSLAQRIRVREFSALELLDYFLARVDRFNPDINAIVVDDRQRAREAAASADAALRSGYATGALHGVPMTIKESYDVAGLPTTWGFPESSSNIAVADAVAVERLKAAGAVIFGKTNVPIALGDFQSYNDVYGTTNNPWRFDRTPGGSSGGSAAALAAGMTALEAGSDIGGSIRNPAHFCGVFGHKPTWQLIPYRGHSLSNTLTPTDISVVGPLARSAADLECALRVMAGPDVIEARGMALKLALPRQQRPGDFRVAVWHDDAAAPVAAEVRARVDRVAEAFAAEGAVVSWEARPAFAAGDSQRTYNALLQAALSTRQSVEDHERLIAAVMALEPADESAEAAQLRSRLLTFHRWHRLNEERTRLRWAWHSFFSDWDIVLAPVTATAAFLQDQRPPRERNILVDGRKQSYFQQIFWAGLASVACLPATVVPTGLNDEGLPIGVQIIGPEYGDLVTLRAACQLEQIGFSFQPPARYRESAEA
jgi:amidase